MTSYSGSSGSFTVDASGVISGSETGLVVNGSWYVNGPVTSATSYTSPSGRTYTAYSVNMSYALDANGQVVATSGTETYSGSGHSFTIANGVISGSETGIVVDGNWYVNYISGSNPVSYASPNGNVYTLRTAKTIYGLDGSGQVVGSTLETYSGSNGSFSFGSDGAISSSEGGYVVNGIMHVNTNTSRHSSNLSLFGNTYISTGGGSTTTTTAPGAASHLDGTKATPVRITGMSILGIIPPRQALDQAKA